MAQVEVGLEDEEHAQILSGLSADDMVVSTWSSNLYEGAKIRLRDEVQPGEEAQFREETQAGETQAGNTTGKGTAARTARQPEEKKR